MKLGDLVLAQHGGAAFHPCCLALRIACFRLLCRHRKAAVPDSGARTEALLVHHASVWQLTLPRERDHQITIDQK
jgi:hypothetical protein